LDVDDMESTKTPSWGNMGFKWFATYISFGTLIHHLVLFFVEVFTFENTLDTLLSIFLSSIFTIVLILIMGIITYKRKSSIASQFRLVRILLMVVLIHLPYLSLVR